MDVEHKIIFNGMAGSHSYGTNTPTSDVDERGIFVIHPDEFRTPFGQTPGQITDTSKQDAVLYELNKFMSLYLDANPNIVELLWIDPQDILVDSNAYQLLRSHNQDLLSSKVAFTFSGYAMAQLKRIKGHKKWISQEERGIQKLRTAYQNNEIDDEWLSRFPDDVIQKVKSNE